MYDVCIMPDPNKNPKGIYDLFRHSGRFNLKQIIGYVDTFKSTADQYDLEQLDWSGRYMYNYLDPYLLDNTPKNNTVT